MLWLKGILNAGGGGGEEGTKKSNNDKWVLDLIEWPADEMQRGRLLSCTR